jgi:uncharacterized SAM-binding protein YcdF (DUF218 family)
MYRRETNAYLHCIRAYCIQIFRVWRVCLPTVLSKSAYNRMQVMLGAGVPNSRLHVDLHAVDTVTNFTTMTAGTHHADSVFNAYPTHIQRRAR